jgi:Domain of unknown function (DUF4278)
MKLTYRGVDYDYNPPMLAVTESEIKCQYRGQPARYSYVQHVPIPQPVERLTYRGVPYQTTRQGQVLQFAHHANNANSPEHKADAPLLSRWFSRFAPPLADTQLAGTRLRNKLTGNSPASQARRQLLQSSTQLHQDSMARSLQHRMDVAKQQGNERLVEQLQSEMSQIV